MAITILVIYDPKGRAIESLAVAAGEGIAGTGLVQPRVMTIDETTRDDLLAADGLLLGSPNWSGITGTTKQWLDDQGDLWEEGVLAGKPAGVFTTGSGRHSGLEMTLLQLVHWVLACGMVLVGLPWSDRMRTSGSYYGATAAGGVTEGDLAQARMLGTRVATIAAKLAAC